MQYVFQIINISITCYNHVYMIWYDSRDQFSHNKPEVPYDNGVLATSYTVFLFVVRLELLCKYIVGINSIVSYRLYTSKTELNFKWVLIFFIFEKYLFRNKIILILNFLSLGKYSIFYSLSSEREHFKSLNFVCQFLVHLLFFLLQIWCDYFQDDIWR